MKELGIDRYPLPRELGRPQRSSLATVSRYPATSLFQRQHSRLGFLCVFVLFATMMPLPQASAKELQDMMCSYLDYKRSCLETLNRTIADMPTNESWCMGEFDDYVCWNHATEGLATEDCPDFIPWNNTTLKTYRMCHNGSWYRHMKDGQLVVWSHTGQCDPTAQDGELSDVNPEELLKMESLVKVLTTIYTTGYVFSLICLMVALFLFAFFKKLHCTRNYIHVNLMISFILRYTAVLVKDKVLQDHYDIQKRLDVGAMEFYCDEFGGISGLMIGCRLAVIVMHYAVIVNYFWLLAEGVYLQMLLFFAMRDHKYFPVFMAFGWGAPWIPVGIWTALRLSLADEGCWEFDEIRSLAWALQAPIVVSIGINFIIFINIIRIIISKLRANNMPRNDDGYRLARSTLALIPLLGIHYIVFLFVVGEVVGNENEAMHVKIAFEMTFTSVQGMLISILYCFLNGEVQTEVAKVWRNWRWRKGLPAATSRKCSTYHSNNTQMTSVYSHTENHNHSNHTDSLIVPAKGSMSSRRNTEDSNIRNSINECGEPLMGNGNRSEESV